MVVNEDSGRTSQTVFGVLQRILAKSYRTIIL